MAYVSPLPPREHQVRAMAKARGRAAFAYLCDMGTGKSKMILDEFGSMEDAGEISDLLLIAPAGCYANWTVDRGPEQPSEVSKHFSADLRERAVIGTFKAGGGIGAKRALDRLLSVRDRPRILTVNIEALSSVKAARDLCTTFLSRRRAMIAIDESPVIKNGSAERTKAVINMGGLAPYRRIASGLVAPNSPMDLYSQFEFLDWKILGQRSFYGFQARYAVTKKMALGGTILKDARGQFLRDDKGEPMRVDTPGNRVRTANVIVGYKNQEDLRERIEHHSFRVTKEECLDLPPKIYMPPRAVEMTDEQRRIYKELKNVATAELGVGGYVSVQSALTMMLRLQQVLCGHVMDDEGHIKPVSSNRIRALMEIVDQHPRKGIIWTNFDYSIREICDTLRKEYGSNSVAAFWGGNRTTRGEDESRFLGDPECRWMVSTPAAGGRGNTWVNATATIYYSNSYSLDHRLQSEDRNHRDGQKMSVTYDDLVCYDTVDEKILQALRKKLDLATLINGDNWRKWVV